MMSWLTKKSGSILVSFLSLALLSFFLIRLVPGDPVLLMLGERGGSPELYQEMRARLLLDRPLVEQFFIFLKDTISGNFGVSIFTQTPVLEEFFLHFTATFELGMISLLMAVGLGIPLGVMAALKRNSWFDQFISVLTLVGSSMPIFWWGLMMIIFFSVKLELTPVSGRLDFLYEIPTLTGLNLIDVWFIEGGLKEKIIIFTNVVHHLFLPAFVLGTIPLASITRMTRASFLDVLNEDYIRSHRALGINSVELYFKFGLKNALLPVITVVGLMTGQILTGAILTETIFSWPGMGRWLVTAVSARDYPVIQGGIVLIGMIVVFINVITDAAYTISNPKLRISSLTQNKEKGS